MTGSASYKTGMKRLLVLLAVGGLVVSGCGSASPASRANAAAKCLQREGWSVRWAVQRELVNGTHRSPPGFVARRAAMTYVIAFPGRSLTPVGWTGYAPLRGPTPVALASCVQRGKAVVIRARS
jgi:hypothetical protein